MPFTKHGEFWETREELDALAAKEFHKLLDDPLNWPLVADAERVLAEEAEERRRKQLERAERSEFRRRMREVKPIGRPRGTTDEMDDIIFGADNGLHAAELLRRAGMIGDLTTAQVKNRYAYLLRRAKKETDNAGEET